MKLLDELKKLRGELVENDTVIKESHVSDFSDLSYGALYDAIDMLIDRKRKLEAENNYLKSKIPELEDETILEKKIRDFIDWYREMNIEEFRSPKTVEIYAKNIENFIDKVAIWYELRYPEYEINRLFPCITQENNSINDVMFQENPYIETLFDEDSDVRLLEWDSLYNTKSFIQSLTSIERSYLSRPRYFRDVVYFDDTNPICFYINSNGTVLESDNIGLFGKEELTSEKIKGKNIKGVISLLEKTGISIPEDSQLLKEVRYFDNRVYFKNELLNAIMYKIIERGGNKIGPRRAFMFAKEFDRDISIPMKYGVDIYDPGLRNFINEYLKAGGSKDLVCIKNYFIDNNKDENDYETITISELLKEIWDSNDEKYTSEEKDVFKRLVDDISLIYGGESLQKERAKQLRIERRLNKNKE